MVVPFRQAFADKDFVITAEVGPPKGTEISELREHIELLKDKVDGLNVTDNQSSVMRISSLAICRLVLDAGGEPILQLTCRDRNRMALQSELLSADVLGIKNVLCLTGDYISVGDHPQAKPVFDLDSVQLLQTVELLNEGRDLAGNEYTQQVSIEREPQQVSDTGFMGLGDWAWLIMVLCLVVGLFAGLAILYLMERRKGVDV